MAFASGFGPGEHPGRELSRAWGNGFALALLAVLSVAGIAAGIAPGDLDRLVVENPAPAVLGEGATALASSTAWLGFEAATGVSWKTLWNGATGLPLQAFPASFDAAVFAGALPAGMTDRIARASMLDVNAIDRVSRALYEDLRVAYPALPAGTDLSVMAIEKRADVWWVIYQQNADGVPVEGGRADFRYSTDGKLLYFGLELVPASGAPLPVLDGAAAEQAAIDALVRNGLSTGVLRTAAPFTPVSSARNDRDAWVAETPAPVTRLVLLPVYSRDGASVFVRSAWVVRTQVSDPPARFVSWIDAADGSVLRRENEYAYGTISGTATGQIQLATPFDPYVNLGIPNLRVNVSGVGETFTDATGGFSITTPDGAPRTLTSALTGRYGAISNQGGPNPAFSGTATPGVPFVLNWTDANSDAAGRDAYYHVNLEHAYIKNIDPGFTGTDYEMPININLNQTCNAYWDGYAVNFFLPGGGCTNTAQIADVVYHEYGHGVTQFVFAPASPNGSQGEGWSDYIAASMTDQPLIGRGFYGNGTYLRTCDNNRQWPAPECGGEVHCEGEVMAGACWHMRVALVGRLGHDPGVTLSDHLFHFAKYGRHTTYEGYYADLLVVDDDNGTLVDGTPHAAQIIYGFYTRHHIGPGWTFDVLHTPLSDSEDPVGPYPVVAVFSSPADPLADSLAVYYSTQPIGGGPIDGPHRLAMAPTGGLREYRALIPGQAMGTRVRYYVSGAADTLGLANTAPPGAPTNQYQFVVNVDSQPPTIVHLPLYNKAAAIWPAGVTATVTDNVGVSSVQIEWKRNGVDQTSFALARVGDTTTFQGVFNGEVAEGDQIRYRIKAVDTSVHGNTSYLPQIGYYQFAIVHNFADDAEHGPQDWSHGVVTIGFNDMWHMETYRSHSVGHSWKFGGAGNGIYLDSSDGALVTPPIRITAGATLSLWHWIKAESEGTNQAWDGAVVEATTDGGTTWAELIPAGGYTHTIIANPASPFPPGYPCWSGTSDWRQSSFDLNALAGQTVQVRFRFGSDGLVTYEGWYVDDIVLNPGSSPTGIAEGEDLPLKSALLGTSPNPFGPLTQIRYALAAGVADARLDILDVTGRRVRTLAQGLSTAGVHTVAWDGRGEDGHLLGSGVYFARLRAGSEESTGKLLKIR